MQTDSLVAAATTNAYADATTIVRRGIRRLRVQVSNAAVLFQLADSTYWPGPIWGKEMRREPGTYGISPKGGCNGVRFRSAAAGAPAMLNVDFDSDDE